MNMELTDRQKLAISNSIKKSKIHEKNLMHLVTNKFLDNNIDVSYIDKIKEYILNNVTLTTKFRCQTLEKFIENPILKNVFEIHGINQTRVKIENNLFHKAYDNCEHSERVKYGSLNLKNLISGDPCAISYGDCTIFYKNNIKDRTTFMYGDSYADVMYICTFKYFVHLLYHLPISDIQIFIDLIDKKENTSKFRSYVEIQLHGVVDLTKDVQQITMTNDVYQKNKNLVDNFINKYPMIEVVVY
jgi:hypothetical protein